MSRLGFFTVTTGCALTLACTLLYASRVQAQGLADGGTAPLLIEVTPAPPPALDAGVPLPAPLENINLNLVPERVFASDARAEGATYRQRAQKQKIALLLYGVTNAPVDAEDAVQPGYTTHPTKNLKQFIDGHFAAIKRDYFEQENPEAARLVAGDTSFISETMTQGIAQKPAKLAGGTVPVGNWTFGGGYTWGEKNPLLMEAAKKGIIIGGRYDGLKAPVQISYMATGRKIAGFSTGNGSMPYDSVMVGTNIPMMEKLSVNTTLQYRNDRSMLEASQRQVIVTVGTKIQF